MSALVDFFVCVLDFLSDPVRASRLNQIEQMDNEIRTLRRAIENLVATRSAFPNQREYEDLLSEAEEQRDQLLYRRNTLAQKLGLAKI